MMILGRLFGAVPSFCHCCMRGFAVQKMNKISPCILSLPAFYEYNRGKKIVNNFTFFAGREDWIVPGNFVLETVCFLNGD